MSLKLFIIINIIETTKRYVSLFVLFAVTSNQAVIIVLCQKGENII